MQGHFKGAIWAIVTVTAFHWGWPVSAQDDAAEKMDKEPVAAIEADAQPSDRSSDAPSSPSASDVTEGNGGNSVSIQVVPGPIDDDKAQASPEAEFERPVNPGEDGDLSSTASADSPAPDFSEKIPEPDAQLLEQLTGAASDQKLIEDAKKGSESRKTPTAKSANAAASAEGNPGKPASAREVRLQHARELLGKYYSRSAVRSGEKAKEAKIKKLVFKVIRERLPGEQRRDYKKIANAIIQVSKKYEFDPLFLMSVIQNESGFDITRLGTLDEIGLMQLRPSTAKWIARTNGFKWKGAQSLFDPVVNIKIGAAYLAYLREKFDSHARLYLAAYNMGARQVGVALNKKVWPKDYPIHVMRFYVELYSLLDSGKKSATKRG